MAFNEHTITRDDLAVKVKRYNPDSFGNKIGRWWDGVKHKTEHEQHFFPTPNFSEHVRGCGFLTAEARRWDTELEDYTDWFYLCKNKHNLLTQNGRDYFHVQCYGIAASISAQTGTNGMNYIALTSSTSAPLTTDTTLVGEIASSGLTRALGTVAHTASATTSTVTFTFTATGTLNNVQASALFNSTAGGANIMSHEATFTPTTLNNNDQLAITWTLTLS